jgi:hypothetical protein
MITYGMHSTMFEGRVPNPWPAVVILACLLSTVSGLALP